MSSTNKTTYYELPQFVDNDIFNPLVDDNDAYSKIDTALHNIADAEADDASEIVGIKSRLDGAEGDIDALEAQNGNSVLTTTAQTLSGAVNELDADVNALDGRLDIVEDDINNASTGLKSKVSALETQNGTDTLTTTAQTLSGAVNELNSSITVLNTLKNVVTPEQFGAIGNGVVDDTLAINNAIASGKAVLFDTAKTYKCNSYITLLSNTHLIGNGATIIFGSDATLDYQSSNILGDHTDNVTIEGLKFNLGNSSTLHHAITFYNSKGLTFKKCEFYNSYGYVFRLNYCENVIFDGCVFHDITGGDGNPGGAIYGINWKNYIINNCFADTIDDHFVYITGTSESVKITNCTVRNGGLGVDAPGSAYCIYADATNVVIEGCTDINCHKTGIKLGLYSGYNSAPKHIRISNHVSLNNGEDGILIQGGENYKVYDVTIADASIVNCEQDGILLDNCQNIKINACQIESVTRNPIKATYADNILINNCVFKNAVDYEILIGATGDSYCGLFTITNNIFEACTDSCVYPRRATISPTLAGNYVANTAKLVHGAYNSIGGAEYQANQRSITFGNSTDAVIHYKGDIIFNADPVTGDPVGWICTAYGNPGTLVPFGTV